MPTEFVHPSNMKSKKDNSSYIDVASKTFYREWYLKERNSFAAEWLQKNDSNWFKKQQ